MHANTPGVEVSQHFWPAAHATAWLQRPQCCGLCGRSHQLLEWFASGGQQNSLPVGHLSKQSLQSLVVPIRCGSPIVEPGLVQHLQPGFVPGASRLVPQLPQFSSVLSVVHTPTTVFVIDEGRAAALVGQTARAAAAAAERVVGRVAASSEIAARLGRARASAYTGARVSDCAGDDRSADYARLLCGG